MDHPFYEPTIFHVTHPKAGSQWVLQVLHECAPERYIQPLSQAGHFNQHPLQPGMIYPTVYQNRRDFYTVMPPWHGNHYLAFLSPRAVLKYYPNWVSFGLQQRPYKMFVVIRDLRDTLVSLYFSLKHSHPILNEKISAHRAHLMGLNQEEGMLYLMDDLLRKSSRIQTSWLKGKTLLVKYEDLIADESASFQRIIEHCEIKVSSELLQNIIQRNSFQARSGRPRGTEDIWSHHRKGISGDWKNYFSNHIKDKFKTMYGRVLIRTGYENNFDW